MNGTELIKSNFHDRLIGLTITSDLKCDRYIMKVAKNTSKMIGSFYRSREYSSPSSIPYLNKSLTTEYCCHMWAICISRRSLSINYVQWWFISLAGSDLYATLQTLIAVMLLAFTSDIVNFIGDVQMNFNLSSLHFMFSNVRLDTLMTALNTLTSSKFLNPIANFTMQASSHELSNYGAHYR